MSSTNSSYAWGILPRRRGSSGRSSSCSTTRRSLRGGGGRGGGATHCLGGRGGAVGESLLLLPPVTVLPTTWRPLTFSTSFMGMSCLFLGGGDGGSLWDRVGNSDFSLLGLGSSSMMLSGSTRMRGRAPPKPPSSLTMTTEFMRLWRLMNSFEDELLDAMIELELKIVAIEYSHIRCSFCLV